MFYSAYEMQTRDSITGWMRAELESELNWFEAHLPVPGKFGFRDDRCAQRQGVCWFRPEAREHITHAHYLAWLLCEAGVQVDCRTSMSPGDILYDDAYQIVALPRRV